MRKAKADMEHSLGDPKKALKYESSMKRVFFRLKKQNQRINFPPGIEIVLQNMHLIYRSVLHMVDMSLVEYQNMTVSALMELASCVMVVAKNRFVNVE